MFFNQKTSETISKKTATLTHPSSIPASGPKPVPTSVSGNPTPKGQPASEKAVQLHAYQKWEAAGKPSGDGVRFWLEAEQELLQAK